MPLSLTSCTRNHDGIKLALTADQIFFITAGDLFVPFSLLVFNCGDLAGRLAASAHARAPKSAAVLTYAVCRVALVACLALCNIMAPHHWLPPLLFRCCPTTLQRPALLNNHCLIKLHDSCFA